ncbi:phage terminase large subunit [Evansella tamaricis]|uniref:Phage terminase large subunit n=1 Tax=Evansella tamaricis TaxID=2069301 RepID=A0ABS6JML7_9BACI|nr:phage terminase large subunit [Evansella tamaricis]MBU9714429.1 phage terminase large subunit [Evansella tamaricis]
MKQLNDEQIDLLYNYLSRHFSDDEIEELVTNYPLTGTNGLRKMLGEIDIEYFCKAYIHDQFKLDFGDYAQEILSTLKNGIESNAKENLAVVAPRSHGKSTISSLAIPAWAAVYQRKSYILFISANGDISANFLTKIQRMLESPEVIEDFGIQRDKKRTWNADGLETIHGVWVACSGWQSGLRGLNKNTRPDLIILDDLEDKKVMESESLQKKLEGAFRDEISRLGFYKTDMFYIGTLLSQNSLLARVMNEPSWKTLFYQCVKSFPKNEHLWDEWRSIYRNLENPNRMDDAYSFYCENKEAMLDGVEVLWEGRFPENEVKYKGAYYNIMLEREKSGEAAFWKEDQNQPTSSENYILKSLQTFETLPRLDEMEVVLGVDPSMGKTSKADYSALCVLAKHKQTTRKYVIDGQLHKVPPNELIKMIIDLCKKYPSITTIGFESVLFQEYIADDLRQKLKEEEMYHVLVKNVKPRTNKHARIMNLEPFVTRGEILFNRDCVSFNKQVEDYHYGAKNDDAPDVLQLSYELVEGIKKPKKIYNKPVGW